MIKPFLKWTCILLIAALLAAYILFRPSYQNEVHLNGSIVRIDRDQYGIATIHASSMQEYLYCLGLIFAQDRLFQLTFRGYLAEGRLSQFLGERTLELDRFMREVNLRYWADQRALRMYKQDPEEYQRFNLMAKGFNDKVEKMLVLPLQFYLTGIKWSNFTVSHIIYFSIFMEWSVSMNMMEQYTRSVLLAHHSKEEVDWMFPNTKEHWAFNSIPIVSHEEIPDRLRTENVKDLLDKIKFNPLSVQRPVQLGIIQFFQSLDATNTWAVRGEYTESGLPILVNDPHFQPVVPGYFYQAKLNMTTNGKNYFFSGTTIAGNPLIFGKNQYFAHGLSIGHGDNQDLFRQKVQGDKYLVDGKWHDLKIRNETILVKTSQGLRQDSYIVKQTHRGPIIHYIFSNLGSYNLQNDTISLSWTGYNNEWKKYSCLMRGFTIDNFKDAQNYLQNCTNSFMNLNILVITTDNHIISQQSGIHPLRRNPQSGYYLKDGTTSEHDWIGVVPCQDRMNIHDPPKGFIVHANNKMADGGYYGGYLDYTTYTARADRIDSLLRNKIQSGKKINFDFARSVLYDTVDIYCQQILHQITDVVSESRQILTNFDCDFHPNSTIATQYEVFMYELYHLMKPVSLQKVSLISFHYMQQGIFNYIHRAFKGDTGKRQIMIQAWKNAMTHLETHFQTKDRSQWIWGQLHKDAGRHIPFRNSPILNRIFDLVSPGFGNFHTPNVGKMQKLQFNNFQSTQRAVLRTIYTFGQKDQSEWCIDTGVSENILSKHYNDQWKKLIRNEMVPVNSNSNTDMNTNKNKNKQTDL